MKYHRLSRYKIKRIIFCFSEDITASSASKILHINRNTINAYYNEIREKILQHSLKEQEKELGEFDLDGKLFQGKIPEGSKIHTDGWKACDGLILNGYSHYRVFHSENEFAREKSHVNGIECFRSYAKRRFAKFNGLTDAKFVLHFKESECR